MEHRPYYKASEEARRECLETLLEEWETDWKDNFGKRDDGGMVWTVNAADVMLLVDEINRLRKSR